ncbi:M23 family metallopeptidase [Algoriphagus marinus]|uniref:M23 family metallopeptidase n=1 Tax=Algoriphagus marinus TaxID=1925762 RepID=UPI00094BB443|nr:M23 family metallopeptidase [Algoriphagus marinus]
MRFSNIALFLFLCISFESIAQVTVNSERDKDGNVLIFANNTQSIPYSVILNFTTLQNLTSTGGRVVTAIAPPGRVQLTKLRPTLVGQGTNLNYSYSFAKGNVYGKNKGEPIFLIPVAEGAEVTAQQMTHIENNLGPNRSNDEYVGVSFRFKEPTQIVAPRKGIIAEVKMSVSSNKENLFFADSENHIEIYHEDGTITRLMVLKPGSEKVKVGDQVFPGDILAESSGENYSSGLHVRMAVLKTEKDGSDKFKYNVIPVKFATDNGTFEVSKLTELIVAHPKEVIEMEMNKKDLKKYYAEN